MEDQNINPDQIEIKEAELQLEASSDPLEAASTLFGLYFPKFVMLLDRLSNKSLRRVTRALVGVPLEETMPNFKNEEERLAFTIGERLLEAKMVLTINALYEKQAELEKLNNNSEAVPASEITTKEEN